MLSEEAKEKLRAAGREDLIKIDEIVSSGYAGIDGNGTIVDRRLVRDTIPILENGLLGVPKPLFVPMDEYGKPIKRK